MLRRSSASMTSSRGTRGAMSERLSTEAGMNSLAGPVTISNNYLTHRAPPTVGQLDVFESSPVCYRCSEPGPAQLDQAGMTRRGAMLPHVLLQQRAGPQFVRLVAQILRRSPTGL